MSLPPPRCLFALLPLSVSLSRCEYCIALIIRVSADVKNLGLCTVFLPAPGRGQGTHLCHNSSLQLSPKSLWKSARLLPNEISLANSQAKINVLICSCTNHSCTPLAPRQPAISKDVNEVAKEPKHLEKFPKCCLWQIDWRKNSPQWDHGP